MHVYSVLVIDGKRSVMPHASEELANDFALRVWRREERPFVLSVYRKRIFRGDSKPSEELLSVWNKEI